MRTDEYERMDAIGKTSRSVLTQCFTLIELLVVVVIIVILAGLMLPVLGQARARARMTSCTNQLYQFGIATVSYRDDNDRQMVGWLSNLYPDYGTDPQLYVCPQDPSGGFDGNRSGAGWPDNEYEGSTISLYSQSSHSDGQDQHDILNEDCKDEFFDIDDTSRNDFPGSENRNDAIERCSYMYEFTDMECLWAPSGTYMDGETWNFVKTEQLHKGYGRDPDDWEAEGEPWDPTLFPSVRCFYHWGYVWGKNELVLNTSYDGGYFLTRLEWEKGIWK